MKNTIQLLLAYLLASTIAVSIPACSGSKAAAKPTTDQLVQLHPVTYQKDRMNHFASAYEGIYTRKLGDGPDARTLYIVMTRIWKKTNQLWFYNTVFMDNLPEEPLEQEIVQVKTLTVDTLTMNFYKIDPAIVKGYIQSWRHPEELETITPKSLTMQDSCQMYIFRQDSTFELRQHAPCPLFSTEETGFGYTNTFMNIFDKGLSIGSSFYDKKKNLVRKARPEGDMYTRLQKVSQIQSILDHLDQVAKKK